MFVVDASNKSGRVHAVVGGWTESATSWSNAPVIGNAIATLSSPAVVGSWTKADVTSAVKGNGYIDFYIVTSSTNGVDYASKEAGSKLPTLLLQWSQPTSSATPVPITTPGPTPSPTAAAPTASATPTPTASATPAPTQNPTITPTPSSVPTEGRAPVFAYYYLWWSTSHWHDKLGPNYPYSQQPLPLPAAVGADGCGAASLYAGNTLLDVPAALFSQDDPGRILQDVRAAASAGLSGFIVNWAGTGEPNQTVDSISYSRRLDTLVQAVNQVNAEGTPFKLWISYKAAATIRSLNWIVGDLTYLINMYAGNPAFDTRGGRPVLIWTGSRKYDLATVGAVSTEFRDNFFLMGDENWNTWGDGRAAYLDGNTYYWSTQNPYTNASSFDQLVNLAAMVRSTPNPDGSQKLWFSPLAPGYNSELIGGSTCVPRNDGATLRTIFDGNLASKPDGWAFISWNEIAENTHVDPALQRWGGLYLDYLKALIVEPR